MAVKVKFADTAQGKAIYDEIERIWDKVVKNRNLKDLAVWIKKARSHRHLTQKELGEILGVCQKSVSSWETGQRFPTDPLLKPLHDFLIRGATLNNDAKAALLNVKDQSKWTAEDTENAISHVKVILAGTPPNAIPIPKAAADSILLKRGPLTEADDGMMEEVCKNLTSGNLKHPVLGQSMQMTLKTDSFEVSGSAEDLAIFAKAAGLTHCACADNPAVPVEPVVNESDIPLEMTSGECFGNYCSADKVCRPCLIRKACKKQSTSNNG